MLGIKGDLDHRPNPCLDQSKLLMEGRQLTGDHRTLLCMSCSRPPSRHGDVPQVSKGTQPHLPQQVVGTHTGCLRCPCLFEEQGS